MPTMPPTTSGHQRRCAPAAINPKLRTITPSMKAYAPNNKPSTSNVRPGNTNAATPKTTASAPRSAASHQVRDISESIIVSPDFLDEALDERERGVRDLAPAIVDDQRVPAVGHLNNLGHAVISLLLLVRGVGDGPRNGVVFLAGNDQQRSSFRVLGVDLCLGPWVEVRGSCLEQRHTGSRSGQVRVQLVRVVLNRRASKAEA